MPLDLVGMPGVFDGDESCTFCKSIMFHVESLQTDTQQRSKHPRSPRKCTLMTEPCCDR